MRYGKLWVGLAVVFIGSFAILGGYGFEVYRKAPPIPTRVVTPGGDLLFTGEQIRDGQNVWQSIGGQQVGSVWGHGAYVAPDWSADWLHRESQFLLERWAGAQHRKPYAQITPDQQAALRERLKRELRTNTYDPESGDLLISTDRAAAMAWGVRSRRGRDRRTRAAIAAPIARTAPGEFGGEGRRPFDAIDERRLAGEVPGAVTFSAGRSGAVRSQARRRPGPEPRRRGRR